MVRKLTALFLYILLVFNIVQVGSVFAEADVTAPVFEEAGVEKQTATIGENVKVFMKAYDNVGIESVSIRYVTPTTFNTYFLKLYYNQETSQYEGIIPVTSYLEPGTYKIESAYIRDTSNNINWISTNELITAEFTIVNPGETSTLLTKLLIDDPNATPGDTVKVSAEVSDIPNTYAVYLTYIRPITGDTLSVSLYKNSSSEKFEGYIPVTALYESGTYKLSHVDIRNSYNNDLRISAGNDPKAILASGEFIVSGTSGSPEELIETISVQKKNATMGDIQKFSAKLTDNEGIQVIYLNYQKPVTHNNYHMSLYYNQTTGSFEALSPIDADLELGTYQLYYIDIRDIHNTTYRVYTETDDGNFTVFTESNSPVFKNIAVDKTNVEADNTITFTVKATDDTNLQSAKVNLISPVSKTKHTVNLSYYNSEFIGKLPIKSDTEVGNWIVDSVEVTDTNSNTLTVNSSDTDLTAGGFTVLKPIAPIGSYVVTSNETWSNKTVNSDVYIAPGSVLTLNSNVTIKGNIYVLGGLKVNGGLTVNGSLFANYMTFGYYYPSDGQAILSGSNSISSIRISNRILTVISFKLYDAPLVSKSGKVNVTGATLPFVNVSVNGQAIALKDNGTFRFDNFAAGENIKFNITDPYGNEYSYSYSVAEVYVDELTKLSTQATGKTHANSLVKIMSNDNQIGSGPTGEEGQFDIPVSNLTENSKLTFKVYDSQNILTASKEVTVKDLTPPVKPVVDEVSDASTIISGRSEADSTVFVKKGTTILTQGKVDATEKFSLEIEKQKAGSELVIFAEDNSGNKSEAVTVTVLDKTAPEQPAVEEVSDLSTALSGKAEANSKVFIKKGETVLTQATANEAGEFTADMTKQSAGIELAVYAEDAAGNKSEPVTVKVVDRTASDKPMVEEISDQSSAISGSTEPGSTVIVKKGTSVLAQGTANNSGEFTFNIGKQTAGTELTIYAEDASGNKSEAVTVTVLDKTTPEKPIVNEVTSLSQYVEGTAEPGSTITVKADGNILGSAAADSTGKFSITIKPQKAGTSLQITATDKAGNISDTAEAVVTNSFTDVVQNQRFQEEIKYLADKNIITGFPDGSFRPSDTVTRAQAAIMIGRALGLDGTQRTTTFKDVHQSQVASGYIASAVEKGIIAGFPDNSYRPNDPVTRGQMAIFIARAFELTEEAETSFSDVPASSAAYVYIKRILAESITTGYPDGTFKPSKELIRSDFSAFMARALDDQFKVRQ